MGAKPVYKFNKPIAKHLKKCIEGGVSVKDMLVSGIGKYNMFPQNMTILYKVYGAYIAEVRSEIVGAIGETVIAQAKAGDFKSQEFYLRSKGGWSPSNTVHEVEHENDPDEDTGAIDLLLAKLGRNLTDPDSKDE
jgi:hypothetical protein